MLNTNVYFHPVTSNNSQENAKIAREVLERTIEDEKIQLEKEIPIKVHVLHFALVLRIMLLPQ